MFDTSSLLPGTLTSNNASFNFFISHEKFCKILSAAKELYTLNLPGMPTFILSFLCPILTLKSTLIFVTVISFATKSAVLSIPYVFISQFVTSFLTFAT